ncbi:MAG: transpeptidase family protein [Spirochaetaceae bacterium]|jgi:cell division protein FtsI (penicillin-binding protein 3)|nr:transpeptidase family protein [Spirochaetaceae bacterium]
MNWHSEYESGKTPLQKTRFVIFAAVFGILAAVVLIRYATLSFKPPSSDTVNPPRTLWERGSIMDRNGRTLALQTRLGNVTVWKPDVRNPVAVSRDLAPILGMTSDEILERIDASRSDFLYLKKQLEQPEIREIEAAMERGDLSGIGIEHITGRIYPEGRIAGQIVGFVGDEHNGLGGIEYAFETELAPEDSNGNQVVLTVDANVQYILEDIARRLYTEHQAEAVMLMAMDPRNGEILGSASLPDFDPNDIRNSDEKSRMDRPAIWAYEPGSVFKVYSMAALMDSWGSAENPVFVCNGHYERVTGRGERIVINCLASHGRVTARDIIAYSCNAGAAYASDHMDIPDFYNSLRTFGFGSRTGAGNPGETAGILNNTDYWSERSKPTIAIGQEISVSALQMLQAATAIANDGILVPPKIVSRIVSWNGKTTRNYESGPPRRILSAETARSMRSYMVDVTSEAGTGWRANVGDLSLAVKTGTAQVADARTGRYSETDYIASCIALLPAESPSLVLYLVIVQPKGEYLGGRIAAPPVREAAEALADYLGIPRGRNIQVDHPGNITLPPVDIPRIDTRLPDFTGYSKRQILPLLLRDDLVIEMEGDGWVRRQYPPPGTAFQQGMVIRLELE